MCKEFVKIVVFVPLSHADAVREAFAKAGAGKLGDYDSCSFSVRGVGRFRPLNGGKPFLGKVGEVEEVEEERIEVLCPRYNYKQVIEAVRNVHPYEEPAIDVYALLEI